MGIRFYICVSGHVGIRGNSATAAKDALDGKISMSSAPSWTLRHVQINIF